MITRSCNLQWVDCRGMVEDRYLLDHVTWLQHQLLAQSPTQQRHTRQAPFHDTAASHLPFHTKISHRHPNILFSSSVFYSRRMVVYNTYTQTNRPCNVQTRVVIACIYLWVLSALTVIIISTVIIIFTFLCLLINNMQQVKTNRQKMQQPWGSCIQCYIIMHMLR